MESALPTTKATSTMLAPEEIYAPVSSDLRARSELTPVEKRALRNKRKKASKKARDAIDKSVQKFIRMDDGFAIVSHQANESGIPFVDDLREGSGARAHQDLSDTVIELLDA